MKVRRPWQERAGGDRGRLLAVKEGRSVRLRRYFEDKGDKSAH